MIFRLSQKLCAKLKAGSLKTMPINDNPLADWSAHLFFTEQAQYVIVSNTKSLYSTVMHGKGITDDSQFIERALGSIRDVMDDDGQEFSFRRFIAPSSATVNFATALNRSVTASMNDLVVHAKMLLTEGELSPHDTSLRLNDIPFSSLKFATPREAFDHLARDQ